MFWAFKFSSEVEFLAFFDLATFWAIVLKNLAIFFKSSGRPAQLQKILKL